MMLYRNKYRIKPARLSGWDYSSPGYYFITLCTHNRINWFGDVSDNEIILNECGKIVVEQWNKTFNIRHELLPDEFMVMPNHFHAIVHIAETPCRTHVETPCHIHVETPCHIHVETPCHIHVETPCHTPVETPCHGVSTGKNDHWKPGVLGAIVGQFKQQVTKKIRTIGLSHFAWQTRYHDHIIRNKKELFCIRQYIKNNPAHWTHDSFKNNRGLPHNQ